MLVLENKYVLHVPLAKFVEGELLEIDVDDILDELIGMLDQDSFYVTRVESQYNSRRFEELLITIFAPSDIGDVFRQWFLKNNDVLGQEAFAYEHNGKMFIEKIEFEET